MCGVFESTRHTSHVTRHDDFGWRISTDGSFPGDLSSCIDEFDSLIGVCGSFIDDLSSFMDEFD